LILPVADQPEVLAFTDAGRVALLRWEFAGQQPGTLEKFLPDGMGGGHVVQLLALPSGNAAQGSSVGLMSSDGRFKRLPVKEFQDLSGRAASVVKLKEGVSLERVMLCREGQDLVVASSAGRMLRVAVNESNLPLMGRNAQGPVLVRLLPGEKVVGAIAAYDDESILIVSGKGLIKRMTMKSLRKCQRGDIGQIGVRFTHRADQLVGLCQGDQVILGALLADGRSMRLQVSKVGIECINGIYSDFQIVELVPLNTIEE